ncbi:flavin-containing monooxygenase [Arthrobacter sp. CDRTa11]|uniref:flavin-containing monooxygenase n=1 Tax=Arthrobacter sp. CDRTa11 TaxID=2651199 RepID=UPI00226597A3|nr:NAD(P)/FAD-dependent oxidoreductase [Arthrobacter sp. CDRTa11]
MAAQLKRAGIDDFVVLERNDGVGGVWRNNDYPGAACDTEAQIYNYSFFPHLTVSRMYAGRDELLAYLERMVDYFSFSEQLHLGTEVVTACWEEFESRWRLTAADSQVYYARFLIPAWGQLNLPSAPRYPGLSSFAGSIFHSAQWDHGVELKGKRVLSIGTAASAVQYIPEVAKVAAELVVFQRSANWMLPRNQVIFSQEELNAFQASPDLFEASRDNIHQAREHGFERTRHGSDAQLEGMNQALAHLAAQVPELELRQKLTPDYEFGCKRILRSDDYYPALMRPNVELVTGPISRVVPEGVVLADGSLHEGDVIIFGTGFKSQAFHGALRIFGRDGVDLAERWGDSPEAYLGMTVDGFPNMFMIYGPNTNLNHNSIISMLEIQQKYVTDMLHEMRAEEGSWVEVSPATLELYNCALQEELKDSAFASNCSSWYKNPAGRIINNWSGSVEDYRKIAAWNRSDFTTDSERGAQELVEAGAAVGESRRGGTDLDSFLSSFMYGE